MKNSIDTLKLLHRIFSKTKTVSKDRFGRNCWVWVGAKNEHGYGIIGLKSKTKLVHRVLWELFTNKPIPTGMNLLHKCDNPACIYPHHLWVGTQTENMKDMATKGRNVPRSRLTRAEVLAARKLYETNAFTVVALSKKFSISPSAMHSVVNYRSWRSI